MTELILGDCLEKMKDIPDESVDMIFADLPFGTTDAPWDKKIDLVQLWREYKRIIKERGAIVLFSQLPFTCELITNATVPFRYEWIWQKTHSTGFLNAHKMPMRAHENILVFYKHLPTYNPQYTYSKPYTVQCNSKSELYSNKEPVSFSSDGRRYPIDVLQFSNHSGVYFGAENNNHFHSTQKPVPLLEYLIKTYTNPGETVLDNTMGSGSTGVACVNTGRNFIGIELDEKYYKIACDRINNNEV